MYRILRNTHLLLGLFACLFLLMYGVSAVQMAHRTAFRLAPTVTEQNIPVAGRPDVRPLARSLMNDHGLRGELQQVDRTEAGWRFRIARPGTVYEVSYDPAAEVAHVRTRTAGFLGMLNRIHHAAGLWHQYGLMNAWGLAVGAISLVLLALGVTGIYLWFHIYRERITGIVLLSVSLAYSLTLLVLIRIA